MTRDTPVEIQETDLGEANGGFDETVFITAFKNSDGILHSKKVQPKGFVFGELGNDRLDDVQEGRL